MAESHSTDKPAKPYPEYPLYAHNTQRWAKKICGVTHYFGPWDDPDGALTKYLAEKDELHAGRTPVDNGDGFTVGKLCGKFLTTKKRLFVAGELSIHSRNDYRATCKRLQKELGKLRIVADLRPADFEKLRAKLAKGNRKAWGPVRLGNEINRIRVVFNYAYKGGMIDRPMVYGEGFKRPSKKTLRKHRAAKGPRMFEAAEILRMLESAGQPLRTMILLGLNCAYGNQDVGTLPLSAINLVGGWVDFPRPKTGIPRRCPLWPETAAALLEWLAERPKPASDSVAHLAFLTVKGGSWAKATSDNPVSKETAKLLKGLGINGGRNFYGLRHSFQTVADEAKDFVATRLIMGHVGSDIADEYRERVSDDRLRTVVEHVRGWLFGDRLTGQVKT